MRKQGVPLSEIPAFAEERLLPNSDCPACMKRHAYNSAKCSAYYARKKKELAESDKQDGSASDKP